jgi:sugar phosphate isomerase/epimerase
VARGGVALQMYTVREEQGRDFRGTLRQVREIGYPAVEFAGYGNLGPEELRTLLAELGLQAAGTHTGLEALERDFAGTVALHRAIGASFVTVPSLSAQRYPRTEAGFRQAARDLDAMGARLAAEGLTLAYHNHDFEFFRVGDGTGLDLLYAEADPAHLHAELDVYWAARGGVDPAAYIRKLGSRCSLVHIKDMAADGSFAEVGTGSMDFPAIFAAGDAVGTRWYIVEQDVCRERPPLEAIRVSLDNLRRWGRL